jgi:hypothetical protein
MHRLIVVIALLLTSGLAIASEKRLQEAAFAPQVTVAQTTLALRNQTVLTYLWVDVYAAALYTQAGVSPRQALANDQSKRLELYYFRDIDRSDVIKAAWVTLERQHDQQTLERLRPEIDALHEQFQSIRAGDRYALVFTPSSGLSLERNGEILFTRNDPALASAYLGIWLAPKGLSDSLRATLLADS